MQEKIESCVKQAISVYFDVHVNWKPLVIQDNILKDADWIAILKAIVKCLENDCPLLVEGDILPLRAAGKTFQDAIDKIGQICPQ
jgi:hypothetical protein